MHPNASLVQIVNSNYSLCIICYLPVLSKCSILWNIQSFDCTETRRRRFVMDNIWWCLSIYEIRSVCTDSPLSPGGSSWGTSSGPGCWSFWFGKGSINTYVPKSGGPSNFPETDNFDRMYTWYYFCWFALAFEQCIVVLPAREQCFCCCFGCLVLLNVLTLRRRKKQEQCTTTFFVEQYFGVVRTTTVETVPAATNLTHFETERIWFSKMMSRLLNCQKNRICSQRYV